MFERDKKEEGVSIHIRNHNSLASLTSPLLLYVKRPNQTEASGGGGEGGIGGGEEKREKGEVMWKKTRKKS